MFGHIVHSYTQTRLGLHQHCKTIMTRCKTGYPYCVHGAGWLLGSRCHHLGPSRMASTKIDFWWGAALCAHPVHQRLKQRDRANPLLHWYLIGRIRHIFHEPLYPQHCSIGNCPDEKLANHAGLSDLESGVKCPWTHSKGRAPGR